ncbi:hypothetical protein KDA_71650 [Dictyobacter alpinus]|uniref:Uncharacterized protein n=1 Tax=Dictyobacter alpinus TaxID=2014873 RepID=A0A402BK00_9CHLR|nr:hypothetical protein [Dictyobacter alpinus]GCE31681.1 hypothetical protein KDA_71650 [Dictyobacter alpinus]
MRIQTYIEVTNRASEGAAIMIVNRDINMERGDGNHKHEQER